MWNYRLIRHIYKVLDEIDQEYYEVHEVFYDDKGIPISCTEASISPGGGTIEEAKTDYDTMKEAFDQEILDYTYFEEKMKTTN